MIICVIVGCVVAVFGLGPAALGKLVERMQDEGRRCVWHRPRAATVLVMDLLGLLPPASAPATWAMIRAGMNKPPRRVDTGRTLAEMNGAEAAPIVTDAEEFERMPLAPATHPYAPTVLARHDGRIEIDEHGHLTVHPCKQPWDTTSMPAIPAPEPGPAWRTATEWDSLGPQVPIARPYAPSPTWGEACQLDVAEAERLAEAMRP